MHMHMHGNWKILRKKVIDKLHITDSTLWWLLIFVSTGWKTIFERILVFGELNKIPINLKYIPQNHKNCAFLRS